MSLFYTSKNWINKCTGIELQLLPDNQINCNFCDVSLIKDKLTIGAKKQLAGELQAIVKETTQKIAVIAITGKGILTKKTSRLEIINNATMNALFPNLQIDQFYIQNLIADDFSFISLVRKESVDVIVQTFSESGIQVFSVSLGPFAVMSILNQLNVYDQKIQFDGHLLEYSKDLSLQNYQYTTGLNADFPIKIDIEPIPENYLIAYANAFQLLLYNQLQVVEVNVPIVKQRALKYGEEKYLRNTQCYWRELLLQHCWLISCCLLIMKMRINNC